MKTLHKATPAHRTMDCISKTTSLRPVLSGRRWLAGPLRLTVLFVIGASCLSATGWAAAPKTVPRYKPSLGATNIYSVKIETRGETGAETLAGNIFVSWRPGPSNVVTLRFRGTLNPRREGSQLISVNSSGPQPNWYSPVILAEGCELQIDPHGRVLRSAGDIALPVPLGALAQSFIEPLPISAQTRWSTTEELAVIDEPRSVGPALSMLPAQTYSSPYYGAAGSRGPLGMVAVLRQCTYEGKGRQNQRLTVEKRLTLSSSLFVGAEPKFAATGEGEFEFDEDAGMVRRVDMKYRSVVTTEAVTRRASASIQLVLLAGKELETALEATLSRTTVARRLTPEDLQTIAESLKSQDEAVRLAAAAKLQVGSYSLTNVPSGLLETLAGLLEDRDLTLRSAAQSIVAQFGTTEHVPALLRMLKGQEFGARSWAFRSLGRLKDKRAIGPLVECVARGDQDAYSAVEALGKFGPEAEDAVLTLVKEKHSGTRSTGCNILRQIGTAKSIPVLSDMALDQSESVSRAAADAVRAIKARE